ncbi:MAG: hypothetical protein IPL84_06765 [Chitinophagaceae bacterium]|nr:hypothetical protein [Chitinophagaceae bacterium]
MKTCKLIVSSAFLLLSGTSLFAQEVDITKGDLSVLKAETSINIELTYEKMAVGDFSKEADYIKKRIEELNTKEPGTGDTWAVKWEENKKTMFVEKFSLGFTKQNKMTVSPEAKYTLIFNSKALEPGYQVGVSKRNAGVDGTVTLVETAKRDKKLAVLFVERAPESKWRGAAFDAASRIGDAYFMDGQKVGKFITKNNK